MFLSDSGAKGVRGMLDPYYSADTIDAYLAAVNSVEPFVRRELNCYENLLTNYYGDQDYMPHPFHAQEVATVIIESARDVPLHVIDIAFLIDGDGDRAVAIGALTRVQDDLKKMLDDKFGWVPEAIYQRVMEQRDTGVYRVVYKTDAY